MRGSGPWTVVGRVWPQHEQRGRLLNAIVRRLIRTMTIRTAAQATYDDYLEYKYPITMSGAIDARTADTREREVRLAAFPYSVVLQVAYPELDYANRWCWQRFGPAYGPCLEASSNYPACPDTTSHSHEGRWLSHWLAKTDYDFGFNEWHFAEEAHRDRFLEFVPEINWGEEFPQ